MNEPEIWQRFRGGPLGGVRRRLPEGANPMNPINAAEPDSITPGVHPLDFLGTAAVMMPAIRYVTYRPIRTDQFSAGDIIEVIMAVAP